MDATAQQIDKSMATFGPVPPADQVTGINAFPDEGQLSKYQT